jgi:hypothetical protein
MTFSKPITLGLLVLGMAAASACVISDEGSGPTQERVERVPLAGLDSAEIALNLAAGKLTVRGSDGADLVTGTFRYNKTRLEPGVDFSRNGSRGRVVIRHRRRSMNLFGRIRNTWDLELSKRIPLDLDIDCGAGESLLDLRGLDLRSLTVDMGVGELRADLTGERTRSLDVSVDGGVGEATFELPAAIGVKVEVDGGLGSVRAPGFAKDGHVYTNEAWGKTAVSITVSVDAGIGSVNLKLR